MALIAGVASQLLPLAERHPERIAAWLSERAGRPVAFDRVETQWTRRGPLLRLDGLRVGAGATAFSIGDAEMLVSQYAGLLPGRSFTELRLRGLDLTLERGDDGRWQVRGLPGQQQAGGDPFAALEGLGELQVVGGKLAVIAPALGIDARLPRVDVRLRVDGDRVRAGARAWMQPGRSPLQAVFDFDRVRGDGRAHAAARQAELAVWAPLLHLAGVAVEGGRGRGEVWAQLRNHRVAALTVDAALDAVALRGAPLATGEVPRARFQRLQLRARWRALADGWRLDAPHLRIGAGAAAQTLDGLLLAGGERRALLAQRIDVGPLLAVAALSDRMAPGLRQWIVAAKPQARASELVFAAARDGRLRASGRIDGLGFAPVGDAPGLAGLGGTLQGDDDGFAFQLDPAAPFRFDWPRGFGTVHPARLAGTLVGWREGAGWRLATPGLRVRGSDFGADVRGGLWFQGDGTRPWIDLAAQLQPTAVTAAKGFWIHHLMPPAVVQWLDAALVGGRLEDGRALVSGDLDDWPFRDRNGRFEARARLREATLKFQPDWPAAEHVDADLAFIADGFSVGGQGVLAGVGIRRFDAGIERFGAAALTVRAQGGGDAAKLLGLLRRSPLQQDYGSTLDNLSASGLAAVTFDLDLPLHDASRKIRLGGTVALAGAKLAEKRWKLAFEDVRGRATYGRGGFVAERLAVRHDGQPGRLSLRAGDGTRDRRQAFEAELDASLPAQRLLQRVPELVWLQPYVAGRSAWTAAVAIPRAASSTAPAPARLQLRSSLIGTALSLPAPLRKPAGEALAASIETALPVGSGEVRVTLGKRMALRARSAAQTGVRVALGEDTVAEAPPASGLVVGGRAGELDALEWIAVAKGGAAGRGDGQGLALRRIDVRADRLALLGASFPDTRLQLAPAPGGLSVQVQGAALEGSLRVPDASDATVAGRFARVHWRGASLPGAAAAGGALPASAPPAGTDAIDPARVPPLAFDIADLRVGEAALGSATLRTQPLALGMRIAQLQTRARRQRIDIQGTWLGRGAAARTQLNLAIDSDDFGALLGGFGYGGQLTGGDGRASLDAAWPGSPAAFALATLDGTLTLDARNGQLTEVEPGAGRVLGLLSIAQLPRRLTLDFRDFFARGFAFDKLAGTLRIDAGKAHSDDLLIDGPAAQIRIRGSADLRAQTFDQTIDVLPRAGNLLTAVGAIAGGPVGAAIGAAANAVLRKPLGQLAAKTYRVTGPWKEPRVEVVDGAQSRVTAVHAPPPAG
ncbi:TIGR02099 family protein [Luteimonas weifangensis]|uniref:TIGR02099 family protein n=2 Tax=Cognatiluteimonas weifangensis TaxID=2303539 RepID=A0A372DSS1_9GAMM|nr:TIGR02099 family protein [Luteimonas weifangensis]